MNGSKAALDDEHQAGTTPVTPIATPAAPASTAVAPAPVHKAADPMSTEVTALDRIRGQIAEGHIVGGTIRGKGGLNIKGTVEGDVFIEDDEEGYACVMIAQTGLVKGIVNARRVIVLGEVESVVARAQLVVSNTGRITQHAFYERIATQPGAEIEGTLRKLRDNIDPIAEIRRSRGQASVASAPVAPAVGSAAAVPVAANEVAGSVELAQQG